MIAMEYELSLMDTEWMIYRSAGLDYNSIIMGDILLLLSGRRITICGWGNIELIVGV